VLCVDLQGNVAANLHDKNVYYAYLLSLCATGRVRAVLLGPPCRTISALRYQHKKRKPTTTATNMMELFELDGLRGEPEDEQRATAAFRAMSMQQRMQESKTWACWAQG
jgi:hypothetical protein